MPSVAVQTQLHNTLDYVNPDSVTVTRLNNLDIEVVTGIKKQLSINTILEHIDKCYKSEYCPLTTSYYVAGYRCKWKVNLSIFGGIWLAGIHANYLFNVILAGMHYMNAITKPIQFQRKKLMGFVAVAVDALAGGVIGISSNPSNLPLWATSAGLGTYLSAKTRMVTGNKYLSTLFDQLAVFFLSIFVKNKYLGNFVIGITLLLGNTLFLYNARKNKSLLSLILYYWDLE